MYLFIHPLQSAGHSPRDWQWITAYDLRPQMTPRAPELGGHIHKQAWGSIKIVAQQVIHKAISYTSFKMPKCGCHPLSEVFWVTHKNPLFHPQLSTLPHLLTATTIFWKVSISKVYLRTEAQDFLFVGWLLPFFRTWRFSMVPRIQETLRCWVMDGRTEGEKKGWKEGGMKGWKEGEREKGEGGRKAG